MLLGSATPARRPRARVVGAVLACLVARVAAADDLLVFAAASLTDVLRELGTTYERTSHDRVAFDFGGSNDLARQIEAGAPADVFYSADVDRMAELERAGLVRRAERRDVLSNVLAVVVAADSSLAIRGPRDVTQVRHLALADPEAVPAGRYAAAYLRSAGVWDALRDAIVPHVDVRAALASVEAGRADAAIVYATDAAVARRVRIAYRVPREQAPPIVYAVAPLASSKRDGARAFARYLASDAARPVYERFGFVVLPPG